jgi:hypothetical protein
MRAILIDWLVDVHLKFKVGASGGAALGGADAAALRPGCLLAFC